MSFAINKRSSTTDSESHRSTSTSSSGRAITYTREELLSLASSKPTSAQRERISSLRTVLPEVVRPLPVPSVAPVEAPRSRRRRTAAATPGAVPVKEPQTWRRPLPAAREPAGSWRTGAAAVEQRNGNWRSAAWKGTRRRPAIGAPVSRTLAQGAAPAHDFGRGWAMHGLLHQPDWDDRFAVEMWRHDVSVEATVV